MPDSVPTIPWSSYAYEGVQRMLRIGCTGVDVSDLQAFLNLLPTRLKQLAVDGIFGPFTKGRVLEFQGANGLSADGIVGDFTWEELGEQVEQFLASVGFNTLKMEKANRDAIVKSAEAEASQGGVHAKTPGAIDQNDHQQTKRPFRVGFQKLLNYFAVSAPGQFPTDGIIHWGKKDSIAPMAHWCGIFDLWAYKSKPLPFPKPIGNWVIGMGIRSVLGFRELRHPTLARRGDICIITHPPDLPAGEPDSQHHFIVQDVVLQNGRVHKFKNIEGNSGRDSEFMIQERQASIVNSAFTIF